MGDGDDWARCAQGHTHWGRFGAAGLLLFHTDGAEPVRVLLQQRAWWCSGGGTWGLFGGGRHSHEDPVTAALRETAEESTLDPSVVRVHGVLVEDHGGWDFTTVVGSAAERPQVRPASFETRRAEWVPVDEVADRRLFAPFAAAWPRSLAAMHRVVVVVDVANVMGSRADGWWRDRAGAAARLRDELAGLATTGVTDLPPGLPAYDRCLPEMVLVVEGAARRVAEAQVPGITVVAAPGSGDDTIVEEVSRAEPRTTYLAVTADRELRARCTAAGAAVTGPRWLLDRLPAGPRRG
ncbi:NUDIX hydrolase [Actinomadura craniellae]|uniref:NUDIX hydrolase n=1 Tax=Actinomadura craniellae TaxID=2231787 RepID=A0A365H385_9ACTN|nr:NUDIX domain-containing protein [Actinomadura craniellae]RAY13509.1 NUDIX hydrolase [Actinomadura craniellae]